MTEAYPLKWPEYKKRAGGTQRAAFKTSFEKARKYLTNELKLIGAQHPVISTNIPLRNDGFPYADYKKPADRGVAVYFQYKGKAMCFACDRWEQVEHNIQAIGHTISALRGIARWGTGDMLQAAFDGFQALPPPGQQKKAWHDILEVRADASIEVIKENYRRLARDHHPDRHGGNADRMAEINTAYAEAIKERTAL